MKVRLSHAKLGEFAFNVEDGRAVIIGRAAPEVDVELNWDARVSRWHARLWVEDGALWIQDLGSRNGTWLGDERLGEPARLEPGVLVRVGDTRLVPGLDQEPAARGSEATQPGQIVSFSPIDDLQLPEPVPPRPLAPPPRAASALVYEPPAPTAPPSPAPHLTWSPAPVSPSPTAASLLSPAAPAALSPPAPARTPPPVTEDIREHPRGPAGRFVSPQRLEIHCSGPDALRALWMEHLARGGVFVETLEPRATNQPVELSLSTPDGRLVLAATVVHAVAPGTRAPPGLGLHIVDLGAAKQAILAYAERRAPTLGTPRAPDALDTSVVDAAVAQARKLLEQLGTSDVYRALEIAPETTDAALKERIATIARSMSAAAQAAPPQKAARIEAAVLALGRLAHALGDPLRRLEHDLSRGHVRAEARLAAASAGAGPSVGELRAMWQKVAPEKSLRATAQAREAYAARERGELDVALRAGRAALADNPFLEDLRSQLAIWEKRGDELPSRSMRPGPPVRRR